MPRRRPATAAAATVAEASGPPGTRTVAVQTVQAVPSPPQFRPLAPMPNPAGPIGEFPLEGYEESALSVTWQARCINNVHWPAGADRTTRAAVVRGLAAQVQPALLDYQQFRTVMTDWAMELDRWLHMVLLEHMEETYGTLQREIARRNMDAADMAVLRERVAQNNQRVADLQAWRAAQGMGAPAPAASRGAEVNIREAIHEAQRAARRSRPPSPGPVVFQAPVSAATSGVSTPVRPASGSVPPPYWRQAEDGYIDPHYA